MERYQNTSIYDYGRGRIDTVDERRMQVQWTVRQLRIYLTSIGVGITHRRWRGVRGEKKNESDCNRHGTHHAAAALQRQLSTGPLHPSALSDL